MKLMGHSSIITSQKYYLHNSDANEKKAVEELERMSVGGVVKVDCRLIIKKAGYELRITL